MTGTMQVHLVAAGQNDSRGRSESTMPAAIEISKRKYSYLPHPATPQFPVEEMYKPGSRNTSKCHIFNMTEYKQMYKQSIDEPEAFWGRHGLKELRWISPFSKVCNSTRLDENGANCWFLNGKLNVCDNCVDRWAEACPDRTALIWEGDEPGLTVSFTYKEALTRVCRMANLLKRIGVRKFDTVAIYSPVTPDAVFAMLACARIGAPHVFVFGGFSAPNLRDRMIDAHCRFLVTVDIGSRGGRPVFLKSIVDEALKGCPEVERVVVFRRPLVTTPVCTDPASPYFVSMKPGRDIWGDDILRNERPYCPVETMDSEDALFLLHTSGSTGKPKGILHTTAGYLLYASMTFKYIFDYHSGDIHCCAADLGWITGHTYSVYGPLCNGATTVLFESIPTYPNPGRHWDLIEKHRVNQFYTSPTSVRTLMVHGNEYVEKYDLSSLRVIGSVGEPINAEAWRWLHEVVGKKQCSIVDTYWQTETGGIVMTPLPGATETKPGSTTLPFFGIDAVVLDPNTGTEVAGNNTQGAFAIRKAWPGMLRTIYGDHLRLISGYFDPYPGYFYTGDGAYRDKDGYFWIKGRIDDVMNVAGHRFSSAEIENALAKSSLVAESAVIGVPHPIKGSAICCVVVPKVPTNGVDESKMVAELRMTIRREIGPVASPDLVYIVAGLPKTRSGKVLRRMIRKIVGGETSEAHLGDTSTLADVTVVQALIDTVAAASVKNPAYKATIDSPFAGISLSQ